MLWLLSNCCIISFFKAPVYSTITITSCKISCGVFFFFFFLFLGFGPEDTEGPEKIFVSLSLSRLLSSLAPSLLLSSLIKAVGGHTEPDGRMQPSLRGPWVSALSAASLKSWQAVIDPHCLETLFLPDSVAQMGTRANNLPVFFVFFFRCVCIYRAISPSIPPARTTLCAERVQNYWCVGLWVSVLFQHRLW